MPTSKRMPAEERRLLQVALSIAAAVLLSQFGYAQDLAPRAYIVTPLHSNAITLIYSYSSGSLDFNGAFPIADAAGKFSVPTFSYYHSFNFLGRSANIASSLPYGIGNFHGIAFGQYRSAYRSGLLDLGGRISVNLFGAPAMEAPQFRKWKQRTLLGLSLKFTAPTGQYNPNVFVNWGTNRWSFKPELGYSQRFRNNWLVDAYAGAWFFTTNQHLFSVPPPPKPQNQSPIGSFEGHISHDVKPFLWFSIDGNFWFGGTATAGGVEVRKTRQSSSRVGATGSFPLSRHQSLKVSYSTGAYYRFGGDYENVSVAWQYNWLGKPR